VEGVLSVLVSLAGLVLISISVRQSGRARTRPGRRISPARLAVVVPLVVAALWVGWQYGVRAPEWNAQAKAVLLGVVLVLMAAEAALHRSSD
jgi:hypothetical protein